MIRAHEFWRIMCIDNNHGGYLTRAFPMDLGTRQTVEYLPVKLPWRAWPVLSRTHIAMKSRTEVQISIKADRKWLAVGDNIEWSLHQCNNEKIHREKDIYMYILNDWENMNGKKWLNDDEIFYLVRFDWTLPFLHLSFFPFFFINQCGFFRIECSYETIAIIEPRRRIYLFFFFLFTNAPIMLVIAQHILWHTYAQFLLK